jgi:hypothetical protein
MQAIETKKRASTAFSENSIVDALSALISEYGYKPDMLTVAQLEDIAGKLSAAAGKDPPWGWRYLRNVLNRKIDASVKLVNAIMALGATFDNIPLVWSSARPVQVYANAKVKPGTLITVDSRDCRVCHRPFIPHSWNDYGCSDECDLIWKILQRERRKNAV